MNNPTTEVHLVSLRSEIRELLDRRVVEAVELVLQEELTFALGAEPYERSERRRGGRNGSVRREITTEVGHVELDVPRGRVQNPDVERG